METVYDHNVTSKELEAIGCFTDKSWYLKNVSPTTANINLATLFWIRGKKKLAEKYANLIPEELRVDWWRTVTHP